MTLQYFKSSFQIAFIEIAIYIIQKVAFSILKIDTSNYQLSVEKTYLLMIVLSVIIMTILNVVFQKNKDVVGMTFLLITTIKVVVITIIGKTYIATDENPIEKWNFFGLFILFLFLETYITARRLNQTIF